MESDKVIEVIAHNLNNILLVRYFVDGNLSKIWEHLFININIKVKLIH